MKKLHIIKKERVIKGGTITSFRRALKEIDEGEIIAVACAFIRRDGSCVSFYDSDSFPKLIGSVENLKSRIMRGWEEIPETTD